MMHPVRSRVIFAIADSKEGGISVRRLAERIGEPGRRVRYHVGVLLDQGLIGVARETGRRGVVERYYRTEVVPLLTEEDLEYVSAVQLRRITLAILRMIFADASAALAAQKFGLQGHVQGRVVGEVDQQAWSELGSLYRRSLEETRGIIAIAEKRRGTGGGEALPVVSTLLLFQASGPFG